MLVTDPAYAPNEGWPTFLSGLVEAGVTAVQVRDKHAAGRPLAELVRSIRAVLKPHGVPVLVNDRIDVAWSAGADGVHLGQDDLPLEDARRWLGGDAVIGWSVDDAAQLQHPSIEAATYVAASPVFATPSKSDAGPPLGLDGIRRLRNRYDGWLLGIGGISADNAAEARQAGLDGVAVISAILGAPAPRQAAAALRRAIDGPAASPSR
jgi:thiamine-phosphate pyrophosphorylase